MWSPEGTSRRGAVLGLLVVAGCGFAPAYGPGGAGTALRGRVGVLAPDTPDGFLLRASLEDRLGLPEGAAATLTVGIEVEAVPAAITPGGAITRYSLEGRAPWRLEGPGGEVLAEGLADNFTGYSATGSTVATRAAEDDARERLMALLADEIVTRLLLLPAAALP